MSQINFSEIEDRVFTKILQDPYTSIFTRVFATKYENTENYKQTYNIIGTSGFTPKIQTAEGNTPSIRRAILSSNDITYDLFREKIEIQERDYNVILEKGMQSMIDNVLQSSLSNHFAIMDSLVSTGIFLSNVTKAFDPNGFLISDKVTDLGELDWTTAQGSKRASDVLNLVDSITPIVSNVNLIIMGQKAWRKLSAGDVSESGKIGVTDYIKTQLGVGDNNLFLVTNILDNDTTSNIVVLNNSAMNQEFFIGKLPQLGSSGIQLNEHKGVYEGYTRSIYGGLVIYKKGCMARASVKVA